MLKQTPLNINKQGAKQNIMTTKKNWILSNVENWLTPERIGQTSPQPVNYTEHKNNAGVLNFLRFDGLAKNSNTVSFSTRKQVATLCNSFNYSSLLMPNKSSSLAKLFNCSKFSYMTYLIIYYFTKLGSWKFSTYPIFWKHATNSMLNYSLWNSRLEMIKGFHFLTSRSTRMTYV